MIGLHLTRLTNARTIYLLVLVQNDLVFRALLWSKVICSTSDTFYRVRFIFYSQARVVL